MTFHEKLLDLLVVMKTTGLEIYVGKNDCIQIKDTDIGTTLDIEDTELTLENLVISFLTNKGVL
jgi:hypothetical protein